MFNDLKSRRLAQELTQQQLADKLGRSKSYVCKYEIMNKLPRAIIKEFGAVLPAAIADEDATDIVDFARDYASGGNYHFEGSPTLELAFCDIFVTPGSIKLPPIPEKDKDGGWDEELWTGNQREFYQDSLNEYIHQRDDFYHFIEDIRDTAHDNYDHDLFEAVEEASIGYIWEYSITLGQIGTWITQAEYDTLTYDAEGKMTKAIAALWLHMDYLYRSGKAEMQLWGVQDMLAACRDELVTYPAHDIKYLGRQK